MNMLFILQITQVLSGLAMIGLVLMHSSKSEGIGSIGGTAQMFKSQSTVERGLNFLTWFCGLLFMTVSALMGWNIVVG